MVHVGAILTPSVNIYTSPEAEDRDMLTGKHTVRDLFCRVCRTNLGWKYVSVCFLRCDLAHGLCQWVAPRAGVEESEG
jgi:hypothetical protein